MQHLDEGQLMAWLDGELTTAEQQGAEAHLRACPECQARFDDLRQFMGEADGLVQTLDSPEFPSVDAPHFSRRRQSWRRQNLAWAAGIIAAVGLGAAATMIMLSDRPQTFETAIAPPEADQPAATSQAQDATRQAPTPAAPAVGTSLADRGATGGAVSSRPREAPQDRQPVETAAGEIEIAPNSANPPPANPTAATTPRDEVATSRSELRDTARRGDFAAKSAESDRMARLQGNGFREAAPSGIGRAETVRVAVYQRISMEEAVRQLSGAIRLIDGLTPDEIQVAEADREAPTVRVIYRVGSAEKVLYLEQKRATMSALANDLHDRSVFQTQADSANRLTWNDLEGFHLTLFGFFSADTLSHFKTRVK
jgi:anti-sigma factor RsiW